MSNEGNRGRGSGLTPLRGSWATGKGKQQQLVSYTALRRGHWLEKGGGEQPERGWKSVYLEPTGSTAPKEWGLLAGRNCYMQDGVKAGVNDGREKRKEDREMRQQDQMGQRGVRTR